MAADRPTWALIDEAAQAAGIVEGFANTIARRRTGADARIAQQAAQAAAKVQRLLAMVEREDEAT